MASTIPARSEPRIRGRGSVKFALALTNECVPRTHTCRLYADQQLPGAGLRLRQVIVCDYTRWTKS